MNTNFNTIITLMNNVESIKGMNGEQKKYYVINEIKKIMSNETFERYEPFISLTIDGLINISKKNLKLFVHKKNLCFSCIKNNCI